MKIKELNRIEALTIIIIMAFVLVFILEVF